MNTKTHRQLYKASFRYAGGVTLLEVLLAMAVFVFGMLALVHLQGNLTRSNSDANMHTVAANVAEELIEQMRSFEQIEVEVGKRAFNDITTETVTVNRGNIDYTVAITAEDWFFKADRVSVTKDKTDSDLSERDLSISDFKYVELNVTWAGGEFQVDEGTGSTNRLGSGTITVSSIIPSVPVLGAAKVAAKDDGIPGTPQVEYTPGARPDIVAISLGNEKFKESTTPEPVVIRRDELVETWFDVITYSQVNQTIFLRREEFVAISCDCKLQSASGSGKDGRKPTIWTGAEYAEGEEVGKWYGVSNANQQSQYCDVCCRDHHDIHTGYEDSYRPWQSRSNSNHKHYDRSKQGAYVEATNNNDTYLEACRLVRKDGFFRVAHDFRMNQVNDFPENYLITDSQITEYSIFIKDIAESEFGSGTAPGSAATELTFDGRDSANTSDLPTASSAVEQQLRSRGLYLDTESAALTENIRNCFGNGDRTQCEAPNAQSAIELYPFFEVQLTGLARWTENKIGDPIDVSNDDDLTSNSFSRGKAAMAGTKVGTSTVTAMIEDGNVGLISTIPVTINPVANYLDGQLFMSAASGTQPPPDSGAPIVEGTISNQGGTSDVGILTLEAEGASCDRPTNSTFSCIIDTSVSIHTLTVSNYYKNATTNLIICSPELVPPASTNFFGTNASTNWTEFTLPAGGKTGVTLTISKAPC